MAHQFQNYTQNDDWNRWEVETLQENKKEYYPFEHVNADTLYFQFSNFQFPILSYALVFIYLIGIVTTLRFMQDRKPYNSLKSLLISLFVINAIFGIGATIRTLPRVRDSIFKQDGLYNLLCVR